MSESNAPIFVLCYARSGSTLLRYILDTHPEIVAPPELHLLTAARQLTWVFQHTAQVPTAEDSGLDAKSYAAEETRKLLSTIMQGHARRAGKRIWAEKSVSSIDCIDTLELLFPEARLICLHRRAPDVMASCAQAVKKSQGTFGFEPFVARTPDNVVDGLADYWIDKTRRLLEVEQRPSYPCLSLRYEDLVGDPQTALTALFGFLGLPSPADMLDSIFLTPHVVGPGDSKILATTGIHADSIGHGKRLAMEKLSADRRQQIDELHQAICYPLLEISR